MLFAEKADYAGHHDSAGIPMLDYRGKIGLQYNPIAIAQWGLANFNRYASTRDAAAEKKSFKAADWLRANLQPNALGVPVWQHFFDWEYRDTLKAPWYSGLAQGQGISLLLRAAAASGKNEYLDSAQAAFESFVRPVYDGGVVFIDDHQDPWIEEYIVTPPTHILNGFIWALWGLYDYALVFPASPARDALHAVCGNASKKSGSLRHRLLVALRTGWYNAAHGRQSLLPSPACGSASHHASTDGTFDLCRNGRPLGRVLSQPRPSHARPRIQAAFKLCYY